MKIRGVENLVVGRRYRRTFADGHFDVVQYLGAVQVSYVDLYGLSQYTDPDTINRMLAGDLAQRKTRLMFSRGPGRPIDFAYPEDMGVEPYASGVWNPTNYVQEVDA